MTEKQPELSIIVPVYKVEPYLRECLDSILAQTFRDYELIIVNDGSPDKCGDICDEYARNYPEKLHVIHKTNGGLSSARNAGLDVARGEYIGFVDSDDAILPSMYADMVEAARQTDSQVVFTQVLHWDETKKTGRKLSHSLTLHPHRALERIFAWEESVSVWSKLFRRDIIGKTRFRHGLTNEDFPFVTEILLRASKVCILPGGYYRYRVTPGSITNVMRANFFDIFDNVDHVRPMIENTADSALKKTFHRYSLTMHIMSGVKIVKGRHNKTYKHWLRKNRRFILRNSARYILDPKLSMRWRIKAAYSFLHLP